MKKIILLLLSFYAVISNAQYVGIGTETPTAMLDINGDVVFRTSELEVSDSLVIALDVNTEKFSNYRITEADSAFILGGITAAMDGRALTLINQTGHPMTIHHEDTSALENNRIITGNHQDFIVEDMGTVSMQYDTSLMKWIINSSNQVPAGATVWDTTETGIFYEENVGIGVEDPISTLTIATDSNNIGLTQIGGVDSITLATRINDVSASIGTLSEDVFSLNAGGQGKMHIFPEGNVVIGEDSVAANMVGAHPTRDNDFDSKLSVITGLGETGYQHIGNDEVTEIIVKESIGGVSASFGTATNHAFRLMSNNIGRLHLLEDGRVTISPNYYAPQGQLTVYQETTGQYGITAVTPNNTNGFVQIGGSGQIVAMRVGGPFGSAGIGTYSNTHLRLACNGQNAINVISPSLNVGIGIEFPNYKLEVNGTIRSKELIIETANWPDYVFADDYNLPSLDELEDFIKIYHHLPNIPSANELETNGMAVGEMQKKLMEKIEELTLYILYQDKKITELQSAVKDLSEDSANK